MGTTSVLPYNTTGEFNDAHLIITEVLPNSPASVAGIKAGDSIVSITSGKQVYDKELYPNAVQKYISESTTKELILKLKDQKGLEREVKVSPTTEIIEGRKVLGISMEWIGTLKLSLFDSLKSGAQSTWYLLKATSSGLAKFLWDTITFKSDFSQVTGPIGIAGVVKEANELGFRYLINITAIISINLAVINLVPFPALDGGRLLFVLIEAIIRKPINPTVVKWTNVIGFSLLMLLMLVVTAKDILKLI